MKIKSHPRPAGFTLIELLVVISIIAVLASIAVPAIGTAQIKAAQLKAMTSAKSIGTACKLYASDFNGNFPTNPLDPATGKPDSSRTPSTSNDCLGCLVPDYIADKNFFWLAQDKGYCKSVQSTSPTTRLEAGENHWAYFPGLSETSSSIWPLVADPTTANGSTTYSVDENAKGGTWKAKKAIVVRVDCSATIENVNKNTRTVSGPNTQIPDMFKVGQPGWLGAANAILCPLK